MLPASGGLGSRMLINCTIRHQPGTFAPVLEPIWGIINYSLGFTLGSLFALFVMGSNKCRHFSCITVSHTIASWALFLMCPNVPYSREFILVFESFTQYYCKDALKLLCVPPTPAWGSSVCIQPMLSAFSPVMQKWSGPIAPLKAMLREHPLTGCPIYGFKKLGQVLRSEMTGVQSTHAPSVVQRGMRILAPRGGYFSPSSVSFLYFLSLAYFLLTV